jgi:hypothetical protein
MVAYPHFMEFVEEFMERARWRMPRAMSCSVVVTTMREGSGPGEGESSVRDAAVTVPGHCNTCSPVGL